MKVFYFLCTFLIFNCFSAQNIDLEDRDDSFLILNTKNIQKIEIQEPFFQIIVKGCKTFEAASFEGGAAAYKELLRKYMFNFLNSSFYTLNGEFTFTLNIDPNGRVTQVKGTPEVQNSDVFFDDMQYVARRIPKNWTPAKCDGKPVASQMQIKINFLSVTSDL